MRSGWHGAQTQGWQGLIDAKAAGEAGNPLGPPSFTASLIIPSLSPSLLSPPSLTHSFSNFSGSFIPTPSHSHSLMGELIHSFLHSFTHPTNIS